jgi:hypothetical protein
MTIYGSDSLAAYFMQPGSAIVELNWDASLDAGTEIIATCLGVDYHQVMCREAEKTNVKRMKKDRDFVVDCTALAALLEDIVNKGQAGPPRGAHGVEVVEVLDP